VRCELLAEMSACGPVALLSVPFTAQAISVSSPIPKDITTTRRRQ
jgi:hypothetical protein